MRVDAPLVTLLLSAVASAQQGYNSSTSSTEASANKKLIAELEKEIQDLHHQLDDASKTCDNPSGGLPGAGASSSGAVSPVDYTSAAGEGQASPSAATSYTASVGYGSAGSGNGDGAQQTDDVTSVKTIVDGTSTMYSTIVVTKTVNPIQSTMAPTGYAPPQYSSDDVDATTYVCNPAHVYPNGASCVSTAGTLTLHTPSGAAPTDKPAGYTSEDSPASPAETGPSGYAPETSDSEGSPAESGPAGYAPEGTEGSSNGSPAESSPVAPAGTEGSDNGSPAMTAPAGYGPGSEAAPAPTSQTGGDYYAPANPESTKTKTSTVTIIVTPGQTVTATEGGDDNVHTCTETYAGSGSIPAPPSSTPASSKPAQSTPVSEASTENGAGASSAPAPYYPIPNNNSTMPAGSSGLPTTSVVNPTGMVTSASSTVSGTVVTPVTTASGSISSSANSTSTASSTTSSTVASPTDCAAVCEEMTTYEGWDVTPLTCTQLTAGTEYDTPSGQSSVGCASSFTPSVDLCQVTMNVKTTGISEAYMEVWLPNGNTTSWNGRTMSTDNGGLNGCVHYVDMQYVSGMGFASIGDNAGHNGSSFDGTWTLNNNEAIVDWSYRARHASVTVGKQLVEEFYSKTPEYSYYIGCSTGGAQGVQSAEMFPGDFDGIVSGSSANDYNHLQDWSAHFRQITGATDNDTFLTEDEWTTVQSYILEQCDEPIDGVNDGILEDPTQCDFDVSAIPVCDDDTTSGCLTATQIQTVEDVFKPIYLNNELVYPALLYGSQVDAFRLGLLNGGIQGIAQDWFRGGVYNDSSFDIVSLDKSGWELADELDDLHGNPSAFRAQLGGMQSAGAKMMMYHGMADPMTSGTNSQRYYLKLAQRMGLSNTQIDDFFRFYRISGMAHCGVGGISGAGAWQFGQNLAASQATNNIVDNIVAWVENGEAPDTLKGTKFWYDTPSMGIEFERNHCRFPYRTVYQSGDSTLPESWGCEFIDDWQECADELCSADGSFSA